MRLAGGLTLAFVTALAASCASEPDEVELSDRDAFARRMATVLCAGASACCEERGLDSPGRGCETHIRNEVFIAFLKAEDDTREVVLTDARSCLDTYAHAVTEAATCDDLPHPAHLRQLCPQIFTDVAEGAGLPGDPCLSRADCSSPEIGQRACRRASLDDTSRCTWFVPPDGETCGPLAPGVIARCPEGQGCYVPEEGGSPICGAERALFESCVDDASCVEGLVCVGLGEDAMCRYPLGDGDPCADWPSACGAGTLCDDASRACIDVPILQRCKDFICPAPLELFCSD